MLLEAFFLDGVFGKHADEEPVFHEPPPPTDDDVAGLVQTIARRVQRLLDKRGLGEPEAYTAAYADLREEQPALALFGAASSAGRQALGDNQGQPVDRLRGEAKPRSRARRKGRLCAEADGYNLHAATSTAAHRKVAGVSLRSCPGRRSSRPAHRCMRSSSFRSWPVLTRRGYPHCSSRSHCIRVPASIST